MRTFLILLIVILIGLVPWIDGYLFKQNYLNLIKIINQDARVKIDLLVYEQGWMHSYARIRIIPTTLSTLPNPPHLVFENTIAHGPLLHDSSKGFTLGYAAIQTVINFDDSSRQFFDERLNLNQVIDINTLAKFAGKWLNTIKINKIVLSKAHLGKITWQGLDGTINFQTNKDFIKKFESTLNIGSLLIDAELDTPIIKQISIQSIAYEKNATRLLNTLWKGKGKISIPIVAITLPNGSHIVAHDIESSSITDASTSGRTYNIRSQFYFASLDLPSDLSAITSLAAFKQDIALENLSAQGFINLDDIMNADAPKQFERISQLLTPTSTLSQSLVFNTSLGGLQNDIKVSWPADAALGILENIWQNAILNFNIRIAVPLANKLIAIALERNVFMIESSTPTTFEQVRAQNQATQQQAQATMIKQLIDNLITQGYLKIEGNDYVVSVVYQNKTYLVNGIPFDPNKLQENIPINIGPALPPQALPQQTPQLTQPVPL